VQNNRKYFEGKENISNTDDILIIQASKGVCPSVQYHIAGEKAGCLCNCVQGMFKWAIGHNPYGKNHMISHVKPCGFGTLHM
jgi:hypothetical protein